jgi:N-acylneuraminate cytidylyltransferase
MWPDLVNKRSQDVPKMVVDNGSTYAAWVSQFMKVKTFRGPNLKGYQMPHSRSVDIDVAEDLELAKYFGRKRLE